MIYHSSSQRPFREKRFTSRELGMKDNEIVAFDMFLNMKRIESIHGFFTFKIQQLSYLANGSQDCCLNFLHSATRRQSGETTTMTCASAVHSSMLTPTQPVGSRDQTHDILMRSHTLYRLSYRVIQKRI